MAQETQEKRKPTELSFPRPFKPSLTPSGKKREFEDPISTKGFLRNAGQDFMAVVEGLRSMIWGVANVTKDGLSEWNQFFRGNPTSQVNFGFTPEGMEAVGEIVKDKAVESIKLVADSYAEYSNPLQKAYDHPLEVLADLATVLSFGAGASGRLATRVGTTSPRLAKALERASKILDNAVGRKLAPVSSSPVLSFARKKIPGFNPLLENARLSPETFEVGRMLERVEKTGGEFADRDMMTIWRAATEMPEPEARWHIAQALQGRRPDSSLSPASREILTKMRQWAREVTNEKLEYGKLTPEQAAIAPFIPVQRLLAKVRIRGLELKGQLSRPGRRSLVKALDETEWTDMDRAAMEAIRDATEVPMERAILNNVLNDPTPSASVRKHLAPLDSTRAFIAAKGGVADYFPLIHQKHVRVMDALDSPEARRLRQAWMKSRTGAEGYVRDIRVIAAVSRVQFRKWQATERFFRWFESRPYVKNVTSALKDGSYTPSPNSVIYAGDTLKRFQKDLFGTQQRLFKTIKESAGSFGDESLKSAIREILDVDMIQLVEEARRQVLAGMQVFEVPRSVLEVISGTLRQTNPWVRFMFDAPIDLLRVSALFWNPMWYVGNLVGNIIFNAIGGVNPFSYFRARPSSFKRLVPKEMMDEIMAEINSSFSQAQRKSSAIISKWPPFRVFARLNEHVEDFFRRAAFIDNIQKQAMKRRVLTTTEAMFAADDVIARKIRPLLEEGLQRGQTIPKVVIGLKEHGPIREAVDFTNKWLFNYANLHPLERHYIRRLVPFWTFLKNTHLLLLRLPLARPALFRAAGEVPFLAHHNLIKAAIDGINDEEIPEWLEGHLWLGSTEDGKMIFASIRGIDPFQSFGDLFDPDEFISNTQPLVKASLEFFGGRDLWSKSPIREGEVVYDHYGTQHAIRFVGNKMVLQRKFPGERGVIGFAKRFALQYPWVKVWQSFMDNYTIEANGEPVRTPFIDNKGNALFSTEPYIAALRAAGVGVKEIEPDSIRQRRARMRRSLIRDIRRQMRRAPPQMRSFLQRALAEANSFEVRR